MPRHTSRDKVHIEHRTEVVRCDVHLSIQRNSIKGGRRKERKAKEKKEWEEGVLGLAPAIPVTRDIHND